MEKEKISLEDMILLLEKNMFEKVDEENEERMDFFFTPFQIRMRLKIPIDAAEYNTALQMLGFRGYYKGHTIPYDPDNCAFSIRKDDEGNEYIQVLIRKSKLDEIENFLENDELFNQYMTEQCKKDAEALLKNSSFIPFSILTSGPSENFSFILSFGATEYLNSFKTQRKAHIFIDHELNVQEINDYITPYKEGVKSSYERSKIAVPGMKECHNPNDFLRSIDALRMYYKICKKKNIVVDDPIKVKSFINKWIEKKGISSENNIDVISENYISLRRVSKYLFGEYYSLFDLCTHLKYNRLINTNSLGEAEIILELVSIIKSKQDELLKEREERLNY